MSMNHNEHDPSKMDALSASRMLEDIFESCDVEPNSVPMEALSSYSDYRKERFFLQKAVLVIAIILFLMLPLLFIPPKYEVTLKEDGIRKLPVYELSVSSVFPVRSVMAKINDYPLPVYEEDGHNYTIEPTRNGTLDVEVVLFNGQKKVQSMKVESVDAEGPKLVKSTIVGKKVSLYVKDNGIGVDYDGVYGQTKSGKIVKPQACHEDTGVIEFRYPKENLDVYVPDHIGNTLHLKMTLQ